MHSLARDRSDARRPVDAPPEDQAASARATVWLVVVGFALLMYASLVLGRITRLPGSELALVAPAAGVAVWWAIWLGRHRRARAPGLVVFAAAVFAGYQVTGLEVVTSAGLVLSHLTHAFVGATLLRRRLRPDVDTRWSDPLRTLAASSIAGATSGCITATLVAIRLEAEPLPAFALVSVRNVTGTYLVLSLVVLATRKEPRQRERRRLELAAIAVATMFAYAAIFVYTAGLPISWLVLPVAVWSGLRLGVRRTTVLTVGAAAFAIALTDLDLGPFSEIASQPVRSILAQCFVLVTVTTATTLAALQEERQDAEDDLHATQRELAAMVDSALIGNALVVWRPGGDPVLERLNPSLVSLLQCEDHADPSASWFALLHPSDVEPVRHVLADLAEGRAESWTGEVRHLLRDGSMIWAQVHLAAASARAGAFHHDGSWRRGRPLDPVADVAVAQFLDISGRKDAEAQLTHLALHDELTGLPNRVLLRDRIQLALASTRRSQSKVALIFLDLDHFKTVNDTLGHETGDKVLGVVAHRLRDTVRPTDTVCRFGGDEFVVCCPDVATAEEGGFLARRLTDAVALPIPLGGRSAVVTASAGVALSRPGDDAAALLKQSDIAMYVAKSRGRGRVERFVDELAVRADRHTTMMVDLRDAVGRDEFTLHYQPVVDVTTGEVTACEALVRWQHPRLGLLTPGEWLDVAEESDVMVELGEWVLRTACRDSAALHQEGLPLAVHVNVSGRQLAQAGLVDLAREVLETYALPAELLVLELTETHLLEIHNSLLADFSTLHQLGVRLAVDDFGTGYSSLTQLVRLPVDIVKIDRSFVAGAHDDPRCRAVIRGIVGMADALGLHLVAEGVEQPEEADLLTLLGCPTAQGYLWSPALPLADLRAFVAQAPVATPARAQPS